VSENSVFWNAGGIAFATLDDKDMVKLAQQNTNFDLHPKVKEEWLKWTPKIKLAPASQNQTDAARQP